MWCFPDTISAWSVTSCGIRMPTRWAACRIFRAHRTWWWRISSDAGYGDEDAPQPDLSSSLLLFLALNIANVSNYLYQVVMGRALGHIQYGLLVAMVGLVNVITPSLTFLQTASAKAIASQTEPPKPLRYAWDDPLTRAAILVCGGLTVLFIALAPLIAIPLKSGIGPPPTLAAAMLPSAFVPPSRSSAGYAGDACLCGARHLGFDPAIGSRSARGQTRSGGYRSRLGAGRSRRNRGRVGINGNETCRTGWGLGGSRRSGTGSNRPRRFLAHGDGRRRCRAGSFFHTAPMVSTPRHRWWARPFSGFRPPSQSSSTHESPAIALGARPRPASCSAQ